LESYFALRFSLRQEPPNLHQFGELETADNSLQSEQIITANGPVSPRGKKPAIEKITATKVVSLCSEDGN
jgi:hypothetical protein